MKSDATDTLPHVSTKTALRVCAVKLLCYDNKTDTSGMQIRWYAIFFYTLLFYSLLLINCFL